MREGFVCDEPLISYSQRVATVGWFITYHTYGTWLHGDDRGWVDDENNLPGTPYLPQNRNLNRWQASQLEQPPVRLDDRQRFVVDQTCRAVCSHRGLRLGALHVRTNYLHLVVASGRDPDLVMNDCKSWCTRMLTESSVWQRGLRPWALHGSTRHLHDDLSWNDAVSYVLHSQGVPLPMVEPPGWRAAVARVWGNTSGRRIGT